MIVTKSPIQAGKVFKTIDDRSITHNHGKLLIVPISYDILDLNKTDYSISRDQQGTMISFPDSTIIVSENKSLTNYSSFKHLQQDSDRSLSDIGLVQADLVESSTSKIVARPIDLRDMSNHHNSNGSITNTSDNNSENNDEYVTVNTNMYHINGR